MLPFQLILFFPLILAVSSEFRDKYDYVIVGSGSAGSVVANRLSKDENIKVLLLEAGELPNFISEAIPFPIHLQKTKYDWKYRTTRQKNSCRGYNEQRSNWPRGKVLGGSSVLNSMVYVRGNKRDYDQWAEDGATGWSFDDVLPYFKKSEDNRVPEITEKDYHGTGGELTVDKPSYKNPINKAMLEAGKELGYPTGDYNGVSQKVFSEVQATIRDGRRCSTKKAFLDPIVGRRNLDIRTSAFVTKINFDNNKRATGVTFDYDGKTITVSVRREVILSAGAINSPQLLMLSGIGPKEELEKLQIPVVSDLPVGKNLQDHVFTLAMIATVETQETLLTSRIKVDDVLSYLKENKGILSTLAGCDTVGFVNTKYNKIEDWPDIELVLATASLATDGGTTFKNAVGLSDQVLKEYILPYVNNHTISCSPLLQRPKSKGEVRLNSANPYDHPIIDPNYFSHPDDLKVLVEGTKICLDLFSTSAMKKIGTKAIDAIIPGCEQYKQFSDEYLACASQTITQTSYHPVGTCKMGNIRDKSTVVDPRLRVKGVNGLRVVDASIIPTMISGHINAAAIMIGEKASDMILDDFKNFNEKLEL
ncbi:glucose dehydrogenase [FAD, quinone]-like [Centruroides vittatus]|uniref:glucose dehydrogenase [FAD, quinone]-like n=1 Tax=Centruroides vittatus TaxID=120091 RepID=UPI00350F4F5E